MNKEELIGKLQMVYFGDRNALNELIGYYDGLKQGIDELQQENKRLKEINEEHKKLNGELREESKKYKEVIDKLNNKINLLKTCEDKPKEDIIYPHWEICNETEQELLDILKEVE